MGDELVDFLKASRIEEEVDALAGGQLARFVLAAEAVVTAPKLRAPFEIFEMLDGGLPA